MQETQVWSLSWEDPLEKETATHSSILAWEIPWTEGPGGLQSMGHKRVRHDLVTKTTTTMCNHNETTQIKCGGACGGRAAEAVEASPYQHWGYCLYFNKHTYTSPVICLVIKWIYVQWPRNLLFIALRSFKRLNRKSHKQAHSVPQRSP